MIDFKDLQDELDTLKADVLDAFNEDFFTELEDYEDIEIYLGDEAAENITEEERKIFFKVWAGEIEDIEKLEEFIGGYEGEELIDEDKFEDYCIDLVDECYDLSEVPGFIKDNIDWKGVAEDMRVDYSEVTFRGDTYLYR